MIKKIIKTETTLEGDRLRLEISSSGFSTIYRKTYHNGYVRLDLPNFEGLELLELLLEARQEGLLGPVPRAATSAELAQRGN